MPKAKDVVQRLDAWLAQNRPAYYTQLLPGLSAAQVRSLEKFVGYEFPETFRAFYRWRNGEPRPLDHPDHINNEPFIHNQNIMCEASIRSAWKELTSMQENGEWKEPQWWCRGWIPFLDNCAGSYLCLDLNGSFTGKKGQIIEFWGKWEDRPIVAPSFDVWLTHFVDSLEAGMWDLLDTFDAIEDVPPIRGYPIKGDARTKAKKGK